MTNIVTLIIQLYHVIYIYIYIYIIRPQQWRIIMIHIQTKCKNYYPTTQQP